MALNPEPNISAKAIEAFSAIKHRDPASVREELFQKISHAQSLPRFYLQVLLNLAGTPERKKRILHETMEVIDNPRNMVYTDMNHLKDSLHTIGTLAIADNDAFNFLAHTMFYGTREEIAKIAFSEIATAFEVNKEGRDRLLALMPEAMSTHNEFSAHLTQELFNKCALLLSGSSSSQEAYTMYSKFLEIHSEKTRILQLQEIVLHSLSLPFLKASYANSQGHELITHIMPFLTRGFNSYTPAYIPLRLAAWNAISRQLDISPMYQTIPELGSKIMDGSADTAAIQNFIYAIERILIAKVTPQTDKELLREVTLQLLNGFDRKAPIISVLEDYPVDSKIKEKLNTLAENVETMSIDDSIALLKLFHDVPAYSDLHDTGKKLLTGLEEKIKKNPSLDMVYVQQLIAGLGQYTKPQEQTEEPASLSPDLLFSTIASLALGTERLPLYKDFLNMIKDHRGFRDSRAKTEVLKFLQGQLATSDRNWEINKSIQRDVLDFLDQYDGEGILVKIPEYTQAVKDLIRDPHVDTDTKEKAKGLLRKHHIKRGLFR